MTSSSNLGHSTRPPLRSGTCDVCLKTTEVRDWIDVQSDEAVTCCDPCERDLRAGWEAMTDEERAAVEAEIAEARSYVAEGQQNEPER